MNIRRYIPEHAITTIPALAFIFALHFYLSDSTPEPGIEAVNPSSVLIDRGQPLFDEDFDIDVGLERLALHDAAQDQIIRELLEQGSYQHARTRILEVASAAVRRDDQVRLRDSLLFLGEVAINQQELASAEVYLQEALYLSMAQQDSEGTANSYQLLGQLNIRARELARRASDTYDELWQARNAISRGFYQGVRENLQSVVDQNLEIRRFGAAADAWEAMASLHDSTGDGYQAQLSRIEAARLFASTGQTTHVRRLMAGMDRSLISESDLYFVEQELSSLFQQHQQDLIKTSQARDYEMLYHHYVRIGQVERAWDFRVKSSKTLAATGDRAMYQRQADVIAVLYNSNFAMSRAREYLEKASSIYDDSGGSDKLAQTREMESLIY